MDNADKAYAPIVDHLFDEVASWTGSDIPEEIIAQALSALADGIPRLSERLFEKK